MVYVYTGTHQQDNKKDFLLEYEIATNQWTHLMKGAPLGIGDRDSTCFIHERRFFIVTGLFSPLMSVHFYNKDTGTLTKGPNVPSPIKSTTPVMHGHKVMLFSPPDQKVFRYTLSREHLCITCYQVKNTPFCRLNFNASNDSMTWEEIPFSPLALDSGSGFIELSRLIPVDPE